MVVSILSRRRQLTGHCCMVDKFSVAKVVTQLVKNTRLVRCKPQV